MEISLIDLGMVAKAAVAWLPHIVGALVILLAFYLLSKVLCRLLEKTMSRMAHNEHLSKLFIRTLRITLMLIAMVTALGTLGVDVSALVAGLGLTGFALGFALKDMISNLLSGVLILLHRPFIIGDEISITGFKGRVMSIDMRYTVINTENDKVLIPNSKLFTDPVTVHTVSAT